MPPQQLEEEPRVVNRKSGDDSSAGGTIREIIVTVGAALLLAYLVQGYVVKPFRIPSGSMENTLHCRDRVLVDRVSYHFGKPERGDVVVFHPPAAVDEKGNVDPDLVAGENGVPADTSGNDKPHEADINYIKRIIGLPGDEVEVRKHRAFVNGEQLDEPYLHPLSEDADYSPGGDYEAVTVPKGRYFMMGDHRDHSADSRVFGFVPRDFVIGKAFMVYWPPSRIGGLPEKDPNGKASRQNDPNCIESLG